MNTALSQRGSSGALVAAVPGVITNIAALFEALAVGWVEGSTWNRYLNAGAGVQFVRVDRRNIQHRCKPGAADIPVVVLNHGYSMADFIQHETRILYPGMFETWYDDEDRWWSAQLTAEGFRFAQAPVFDVHHLHPAYAACSFFNPSTKMPDPMELGYTSGRLLGTSKDSSQ